MHLQAAKADNYVTLPQADKSKWTSEQKVPGHFRYLLLDYSKRSGAYAEGHFLLFDIRKTCIAHHY